MPRSCVSALVRACELFARNWAGYAHIQWAAPPMWRRPRGCTMAAPFSCENRGRRAWALLTVSASCDAEHHVGVLARASRAAARVPRTDATGMADAMIEAQRTIPVFAVRS